MCFFGCIFYNFKYNHKKYNQNTTKIQPEYNQNTTGKMRYKVLIFICLKFSIF